MSQIECPEYPSLNKYKVDGDAIFYFRVSHYPYYIAELVHEGGNPYENIKKFFKQWTCLKYKGAPINTHTHDPPANIIAFMMNAYDEYKRNKFTFTSDVKLQINFLIGVVKKWKMYKKYIRPIEEVKKNMIDKIAK